jgi:pimeloyl-ACP methyl ester carboxylesterase
MKYNPYYDQEQFQRHKYADQPTLRLLDWGLERLKQRQVQRGPDELRVHLRQLLLTQVENDLVDLQPVMSILQIDMTEGFKRYELAMDLGGLVELRSTLIWPVHRRPGSPVFICLHGHQHEGRQWTIEEGPAAVLSRAGYACFCPDLLGLGENRGVTENAVRGNITYDLLVHNALLLGWSLNGLRLWVIEQWLKAVKDSDCFGEPIRQLACAGFSLGGELALFLSALHTEIEPVYISSYSCSWEASYWSKLHCKCAYIPGLLRLTDTGDVYTLIVPRPLVIETGRQDQSFPWQDTEILLEQVSAAYRKADREKFLCRVVQDCDHAFGCASQTLNFLELMTYGNG